MALTDFALKHVRARSSPRTVASEAVKEMHQKLNGERRPHPPTHLPDQHDLITELFASDEPAWLLFFDAGRYDIFDQLVWDYFDGDLQRCWNGGVSYTGDWAVRNLRGDFGHRGLFSWVPLRGFGAAEYDGRDHFAIAPDFQRDLDVNDRLEALGYKQESRSGGDDIADLDDEPARVNAAVRQHWHDINGGVVRYLKPHPPFDPLPELTGGTTKTQATREALQSGELSYAELTDAYVSTYRTAFEYAAKLVPKLPGRVVLTSDHGTCLTCGQLFHGRRLDNHDHLCIMPWFEVSR